MTSWPTPPSDITALMIRDICNLPKPPRGGRHTVTPASLSLSSSASVADIPPVVEFELFGTPAAVSREGGSTVRSATIPKLPDFSCAAEIATTASATASSSLLGSKIMLEPTVMTSSVTGGFVVATPCGPLGKRCVAASQSSLKSGSSSFSEINAGMRVASSARWVVKESNGRGYERG